MNISRRKFSEKVVPLSYPNLFTLTQIKYAPMMRSNESETRVWCLPSARLVGGPAVGSAQTHVFPSGANSNFVQCRHVGGKQSKREKQVGV